MQIARQRKALKNKKGRKFSISGGQIDTDMGAVIEQQEDYKLNPSNVDDESYNQASEPYQQQAVPNPSQLGII